jgi:TonB family protein
MIAAEHPGSTYLAAASAVRQVRLLRASLPSRKPDDLFTPPAPAPRAAGAGLAGSSALHAGIGALIALLATVGFPAPAQTPPQRIDPTRLVFLATPGPGGGGGGGGLKQPKPAAKAEMVGTARLRSPIPLPKPRVVRPPEPEIKRPEPPRPSFRPSPPLEPAPPPPQPAVTPQVIAPVASASSDVRDRAGIPAQAPEVESQGSGSGAGAGTGQGSGLGDGSGAGIGPGSGGGTGGGPYRPGSGITAPAILHEVRPEYTDDARRMGIEGDVVLEIVVRHDGTVGDVKLLHGLAGGLDRRATDAVRQWRFSPARRYGKPVDVIVEVAVEFKLR